MLLCCVQRSLLLLTRCSPAAGNLTLTSCPLPPQSHHTLHLRAAIISVLSLPPLQPLMLRAPQRLFDESVDATNAALARWVAKERSKPKLEWIGERGSGWRMQLGRAHC